MVYLSRLKVILIGLALISILFGASNVFAADPHILLRLDPSDLVKSRLAATRDEIGTLLRGAQSKIDYTGLAASDRAVQLRITDANQLDAAKTALKTVTGPRADSDIQEMALDDSEPGLLKFTMTDAGVKYRTSAALKESIKVIKNRLRDLSVADTVTRQAGEDGILVEAPGATDLQSLGKTLTRLGRLSFQLVDTSMPVNDAINGRPPAGSSVLYTQDDPPTPYLVENRVLVSGEHVRNANATHNAVDGEPVVAFQLDSRGSERFKWATTQYVGKPFAVILDDQVISAPVIREPIEHGTVQISGNFTAESANELALLLRTGPLPVRLTIIEEAR